MVTSLCFPFAPFRASSPYLTLFLLLLRVFPNGPTAVGRRAPTQGWAGTQGLAPRGSGALHCEASPGGAIAATLPATGTGDCPSSAPSLQLSSDPEPASLTFPFPSPPQLCEPLPSLDESRTFAQQSLSRLNPAHKQLQSPPVYPVGL